MNRTVELNLFERFNNVVGEFFLFEWKRVSGEREFQLFVDIPSNTDAVLEKLRDGEPQVEIEQRGVEGSLSAKTLMQRKEVLKARLLKLTVDMHQRYLRE